MDNHREKEPINVACLLYRDNEAFLIGKAKNPVNEDEIKQNLMPDFTLSWGQFLGIMVSLIIVLVVIWLSTKMLPYYLGLVSDQLLLGLGGAVCAIVVIVWGGWIVKGTFDYLRFHDNPNYLQRFYENLINEGQVVKGYLNSIQDNGASYTILYTFLVDDETVSGGRYITTTMPKIDCKTYVCVLRNKQFSVLL